MQPIIFSQLVDVRFSDLDPYGHVNSGRYIDLVIGSRFLFFTRHFGISIDELSNRDLGFYISHLEINFLRPIVGVQQVQVESYLEILEPGRQKVCFSIKRTSDSKPFAEGSYIEHPVNLGIKKPQPMPNWAYQYFFHDAITT